MKKTLKIISLILILIVFAGMIHSSFKYYNVNEEASTIAATASLMAFVIIINDVKDLIRMYKK